MNDTYFCLLWLGWIRLWLNILLRQFLRCWSLFFLSRLLGIEAFSDMTTEQSELDMFHTYCSLFWRAGNRRWLILLLGGFLGCRCFFLVCQLPEISRNKYVMTEKLELYMSKYNFNNTNFVVFLMIFELLSLLEASPTDRTFIGFWTATAVFHMRRQWTKSVVLGMATRALRRRVWI